MRQQRTMVDVRGLGPVLKAYAEARQLSVPEAARLALSVVIEPLTSQLLGTPARIVQDGPIDKPTKLSIRLSRGVAARLSARAHACGLSNGAYISSLIDRTPAPSIEVAAALHASTDQLAVALTDLQDLSREMTRGGCSSEHCCQDTLKGVVAEVHRHVAHASRLLAELPPRRRAVGKSGERGTRHGV